MRGKGFTIVELLIVIVVIGILAAIVIVAFNNVQDRGRTSKIDSDLTMLQKAMRAAQVAQGDVALRYVTGSSSTAANCVSLASGTDLSDTGVAATCWANYNTALNAISTASGIDVRGLKDPWNRPYFIDENEKDNAGAAPCYSSARDQIGTFRLPHVQTNWTSLNQRWLPYTTTGC
jgi:prepilin-type N-terminal cleavage/methylation domain-containing protein